MILFVWVSSGMTTIFSKVFLAHTLSKKTLTGDEAIEGDDDELIRF